MFQQKINIGKHIIINKINDKLLRDSNSNESKTFDEIIKKINEIVDLLNGSDKPVERDKTIAELIVEKEIEFITLTHKKPNTLLLSIDYYCKLSDDLQAGFNSPIACNIKMYRGMIVKTTDGENFIGVCA